MLRFFLLFALDWFRWRSPWPFAWDFRLSPLFTRLFLLLLIFLNLFGVFDTGTYLTLYLLTIVWLLSSKAFLSFEYWFCLAFVNPNYEFFWFDWRSSSSFTSSSSLSLCSKLLCSVFISFSLWKARLTAIVLDWFWNLGFLLGGLCCWALALEAGSRWCSLWWLGSLNLLLLPSGCETSAWCAFLS